MYLKFWLFVCLQLAIYCFESPKRNGNRGALIGIVEEEGEHFPKECLLRIHSLWTFPPKVVGKVLWEVFLSHVG